MVTAKFGGDSKWKEICAMAYSNSTNEKESKDDEANLAIVNRHNVYSDACTFNIVGAASKKLQVPETTVLSVFGDFFIKEHIHNMGYSSLVAHLGKCLYHVLQNVNILHGYLQDSMPKAKFPLIFVSHPNYENMSFRLLYKSTRGDALVIVLQSIIKGLAVSLFQIKVEVMPEITNTAEDDGVFLSVVLEKESLDKKSSFLPVCDDALSCALSDNRNRKGSLYLIQEERNIDFPNVLNAVLSINPFFLLFDQDTQIVMAGSFIRKYLPKGGRPKLNEFSVLNKKKPWSVADISTTSKSKLEVIVIQNDKATRTLFPLHGEFVEVICTEVDTKMFFFMATPALSNLQSLTSFDMVIADLPKWDMTREYIMSIAHFAKEVEHSSVIGKKLQTISGEKQQILECNISVEAMKQIKLALFVHFVEITLLIVNVIFQVQMIQKGEAFLGVITVPFTIFVILSNVIAVIATYIARGKPIKELVDGIRTNKISSKVHAFEADITSKQYVEKETKLKRKIRVRYLQCFIAVIKDIPSFCFCSWLVNGKCYSVMDPVMLSFVLSAAGLGRDIFVLLSIQETKGILRTLQLRHQLKAINLNKKDEN
jgi:hypothetical protein